MLLPSLGALCEAPAGARSIWKDLEALARATGLSGRFGYGFWTELHSADVMKENLWTYYPVTMNLFSICFSFFTPRRDGQISSSLKLVKCIATTWVCFKTTKIFTLSDDNTVNTWSTCAFERRINVYCIGGNVASTGLVALQI